MTSDPELRDNAGEGDQKEDIDSLINAFRYFNETATTLTASYRQLEERVSQLTDELERKDKLLYSRLRDLDRVSRYLSALLESISSGVVAIDLDGSIVMFNRMAGEMTRMTPEDAIGQPYEDVMGSDSLESGALYTLQHGPELRGTEKALPGLKIRVETGTTWVVDSLGERVGVLEMFDDISTIRQLEERFEHEKTLSALGEMAAAVAHELRNPLAGIGGFAALLREDLENDNQVRLIDKVIQGVHDLDRLAGNLLFLTRQTKVEKEPTNINGIVSDIAELLRCEVRNNIYRIEITTQLPEEVIPFNTDRKLLQLILTNLGRNALQALEAEGRVAFKVTWQLLANRVELVVEDNGRGIEPENLSRLFNPFFTTRSDGTGLGLALVKKAVELQKGQIQAWSEIGSGSRFTVALPIKPAGLSISGNDNRTSA